MADLTGALCLAMPTTLGQESLLTNEINRRQLKQCMVCFEWDFSLMRTEWHAPIVCRAEQGFQAVLASPYHQYYLTGIQA